MSAFGAQHLPDLCASLIVLHGGSLRVDALRVALHEAIRANLCKLEMGAICELLNHELPAVGAGLHAAEALANRRWREASDHGRRDLRLREGDRPWESLVRLQAAGLREGLIKVWHHSLHFEARYANKRSHRLLDFWLALATRQSAAIEEHYPEARAVAHDLYQRASPLIGLIDDGQTLLNGFDAALTQVVARDLFDHELWSLGQDHVAIEAVAQHLLERGEARLMCRLALLQGDRERAAQAMAVQPQADWLLERAWSQILAHEFAPASRALAQWLATHPCADADHSRLFVVFLTSLAQLKVEGTRALSTPLPLIKRDFAVASASDQSFLHWCAAYTADDVAALDAHLRQLDDPSPLTRLFILALRRAHNGRDLPAPQREWLSHLQTKLPPQSWGSREIHAVQEGKPSLGFGLGTLRGDEGGWQQVLATLMPNKRVVGKAVRAKQVGWNLLYSPTQHRVNWIGLALSNRSARLHPPWLHSGSTEGWSEQDKTVLDLCRRLIAPKHRAEEIPQAAMTPILVALVGHGNVMCRDHEGEHPVAIELERPHLVVHDEDGCTVLRFDPPLLGLEHRATKQGLTLRVLAHAPEQQKLAQTIGLGTRLPKEAREQIDEALPALIAAAPTSPATIAAARQATDLPADGRLHILLEPAGESLSCKLRVRPIEQGAFHVPGEEPHLATHIHQGQLLRAKRDPAAERSAWSSLLQACPTLAAILGTRDEGQSSGLEDALALTLELRERHDHAIVHWPQGKHVKALAQLSPQNLQIRATMVGNWFELQANVEIEQGRVLTFAALLAQVQQGASRFIQLDDQHFVALSEALHRRLQEIAAAAHIQHDVVRLSTWLAPILRDDVMPQGDALELFARHRAVERYVAKVPSALKATLRPYQREGFEWLARMDRWGAGAILADDMGLGKTVMTLAVLLHRLRIAKEELPALIVVPTSLIANWQREAQHFAPKLRVHVWSKVRHREDMELGTVDVVVVSYGLLTRDLDKLQAIRWGTLVFDEAHALKNHLAKRSQAAAALAGDFRVALTGTPLENHLGELWSLFRVLNPGLLGSRERFDQRFAQAIERNGDARALQRLRKITAPFILRRTKAEVLQDLPDRIEILREVHLDRDERALYEAARRQALLHLQTATNGNAGERKLRVLAELTRLRRLCCHPALVAPDWSGAAAKLDALAEIVEQLRDAGHKALIFSQFVDVLARVKERMQSQAITFQYLDGHTPQQQRQAAIDAFQSGHGDVFLISLKAGGTGLNLTAADHVIILDPWWNPAVEDQASSRAHRLGQKKVVTVIRLVCQDTIEQKIIALHAKKRELAAAVLGGEKATQAPLDLESMMELLQP